MSRKPRVARLCPLLLASLLSCSLEADTPPLDIATDQSAIAAEDLMVFDAGAVIDFFAPLGDAGASNENIDESLTDLLTVRVCLIDGADCTEVAELTSASSASEQLRFAGSRYQSIWNAGKPKADDLYRLTVDLAGLQLAELEVVADQFNGPMLRIVFRVLNDPFVRTRQLNELGASSVEIAVTLLEEFGLNSVQTAQVLIFDELTSEQTATALRDVYSEPVEQAGEILTAVGYTPHEVGAALRDVYNVDATQMASLFFGLGETAETAAQVLADEFTRDAPGTMSDLLAAGYALLETSAAVQAVFGTNASDSAAILAGLGLSSSDVARVLQHTYGESAPTAAAILESVGYDLNSIGTALRDIYAQDAAATAGILAGGHSSTEVGSVLRDIYGLSAADAAPILRANFDLTATVRSLQQAFGATVQQAAVLVRALGESSQAASTSLTAVYGDGPSVIADALYNAGYSPREVAVAMRDVYSLDDAATATRLAVLSIDSVTVADALHHVYGIDAGRAVQLLFDNGYGGAAAGAATLMEYMLSSAQAVVVMEAAGYDLAGVGAALIGPYTLSASTAATVLVQTGHDVSEVGTVLRDTYTTAAPQAAQILSAVGFDASQIAGAVQGLYSLTAADAGAVLVGAGFSAHEVGGALLSQYSSTATEVAAILSGLAPVADEVAEVLRDLYALTAAEVGYIIVDVGGTMEHAGELVSAAFELGPEDLVDALVSAGLLSATDYSAIDAFLADVFTVIRLKAGQGLEYTFMVADGLVQTITDGFQVEGSLHVDTPFGTITFFEASLVFSGLQNGTVDEVIGTMEIPFPSVGLMNEFDIQSPVSATLAYTDGATLTDPAGIGIEAPLQDDRKYFAFAYEVGLSIAAGPVTIEAPGGKGSVIVFDPFDPFIYLTGDVIGSDAIPIDDLAIGLSWQGLIAAEATNTAGIESDMATFLSTFGPHLYLAGAVGLPIKALPLTLGGEIFVDLDPQSDGVLFTDSTVDFGVLVNGEVSVDYEYGPVSFSVPLGSASVASSVLPNRQYALISGEIEPDVSWLPDWVPLSTTGNVQFYGRLDSQIQDSFLHMSGTFDFNPFALVNTVKQFDGGLLDGVNLSGGSRITGTVDINRNGARIRGTMSQSFTSEVSFNAGATIDIFIPFTDNASTFLSQFYLQLDGTISAAAGINLGAGAALRVDRNGLTVTGSVSFGVSAAFNELLSQVVSAAETGWSCTKNAAVCAPVVIEGSFNALVDCLGSISCGCALRIAGECVTPDPSDCSCEADPPNCTFDCTKNVTHSNVSLGSVGANISVTIGSDVCVSGSAVYTTAGGSSSSYSLPRSCFSDIPQVCVTLSANALLAEAARVLGVPSSVLSKIDVSTRFCL